eukprot:TRINITY_DN63799_c0_g1_i1.p1 TRINITY_DN63799_c0_g1~~TRINITY_DN63799_c0_g1_i1.p1  ORF type:complete len:577 (+),score=232.32 TRINITY_DN63799_c0_g1_i1:785-2515(+)
MVSDEQQFVHALGQHRNVEFLDLRNNPASGEEVVSLLSSIANGMPALRKLLFSTKQNAHSFAFDAGGDGANAIHVAVRKLRARLHEFDTGFRDQAWKLPFSHPTSLRVVRVVGSLAHEDALALGHVLETNATITELCVDQCTLHRQTLDALNAALRRNQTLLKLHVPYTGVRCEGAFRLLDGIALHNPDSALTSVDLTSCRLDNSSMRKVARELAQLPRLQCLRLACNQFGPMGLRMLAEELFLVPRERRRQCLRRLELGWNALDAAGVSGLDVLFEGLGSPAGRSVTALDLGSCQIRPFGASQIAKHFSKCHVQHLNLSGNMLGDQGASILMASMLAPRSPLIELRLSSDSIKLTDKAATFMARLLPRCSRLRVLDLSMNNKIGSAGLMALVNAAVKHGDLLSLHVGGGSVVPQSTVEQAIAVLQKAPTLVSFGCTAAGRLYSQSSAKQAFFRASVLSMHVAARNAAFTVAAQLMGVRLDAPLLAPEKKIGAHYSLDLEAQAAKMQRTRQVGVDPKDIAATTSGVGMRFCSDAARIVEDAGEVEILTRHELYTTDVVRIVLSYIDPEQNHGFRYA